MSKIKRVSERLLDELFACQNLITLQDAQILGAAGFQWHDLHLWTKEEEEAFMQMCVDVLRKEMRYSVSKAKKEADDFVGMYGWTTSEELHKEAIEAYKKLKGES